MFNQKSNSIIESIASYRNNPIVTEVELESGLLCEDTAVATKTWDKDSIKELLKTNDGSVLKGILNLYSLQTDDERNEDSTKHSNSVGFNGKDSVFLSSLAKQMISKGSLTRKQVDAARKVMVKYSGQLLKIVNGDIKVNKVADIKKIRIVEPKDSKPVETK